MRICDKCGIKIDGKSCSTIIINRWHSDGSRKKESYFEICSDCTDKIEKILLESEEADDETLD